MLKAGQNIDVWVVDTPLGQGGMGSVYQCHNRNAPRILAAVKVLDPTLRYSAGAKARFVREAEILFSLDHPGIVKVRNVRMDVATPYLEMEFVEGIDLERRLITGPLSLAAALPLFAQVADAIGYLHARGVRHRDIKPANLILQPDGTPKIVDFGIAMESDSLRVTSSGLAFGSITHVPPEWLDPNLDPVKWDVYSAGVVFWEVLSGREAFSYRYDVAPQQEVVRILREKQQHTALDLGPDFPEPLVELIRGMTHHDAAKRIASFAEVRRRLEACVANAEPAGPARPAPSRFDAPTIVLEPPATGMPEATNPTIVPEHAIVPAAVPPPVPPAVAARAIVVPHPAEARKIGARTGSGRSRAPTSPGRREGAAATGSAAQVTPGHPAPRWRSGLRGAIGPFGDDPSYAVAQSRTTRWLEVRWEQPERFATWCATQLLNYALVLPGVAPPLPTKGPVRVLLSHDDVHIDCSADVHADGPDGVSYRLQLDALQYDRLQRWLRQRAAQAPEAAGPPTGRAR